MAIRIIHNVKADEADAEAAAFREYGALDVTPVPEADGEVTLVVTYPDRERLADLKLRMRGDRPPAM